jgi:hypothetical protein
VCAAIFTNRIRLAAAASFDQQKVTDLGAQAYADLTRTLLAWGNVQEAKATADHAMALSRQGGDLTARFEATLALAAVDTVLRKTAEATRHLENLHVETSSHRYTNYELEANLRLGELELQSGKVSAGQGRLEQLQKDAQAKGSLLIARQATTALSGQSHRL